VFGRRKKSASASDDPELTTELEPDEGDEDELEPGDGEDTSADGSDVDASPVSADGPFDVSSAPPAGDGVERIDLGGLQVPGPVGIEVRVEVVEDEVVAVSVVSGDSQLQMQAFAAPRTEGIWADVRDELRAGISSQGGTADVVDGAFGRELRANIPIQGPGGRSGLQPTRFVGHDGPRWFLRGVITGPAAADETAAAPLLEVFRGTVVNRGGEAMPPREPLRLVLPSLVGDGELGDDVADGAEQDSLEPFERGPEITEIH
jgi:Protein of unknown function (DUF3710)